MTIIKKTFLKNILEINFRIFKIVHCFLKNYLKTSMLLSPQITDLIYNMNYLKLF